jgi:carboxypeptidase Q
MLKQILLLSLFLAPQFAKSQSDEDVEQIGDIYDNVLTQSSSYEWLRFLCKNIGGRVGGSPQYTAAAYYTAQMLDTLGADTVWFQSVQVPYWQRGKVAKARVVNSNTLGTFDLSAIALGYSGASPKLGVTSGVVEVQSLEELTKLGADKVRGKIVFFSRPMDATRVNTFHAYSGAVSQRSSGAALASEMGAVACLVRSMTLKKDDIPHSGVTVFGDKKPIPALALGYQSADLLHDLLASEPDIRINIQTDCSTAPDQIAQNVIAEIRGSQYPNEVIVVGGHLDSWDVGEGAHDDGAGCVQAMEVLHLFKRLKIRPKRTIRVVLFANEENGMYGAEVYAKYAKNHRTEKHVAAIESDAGGHSPRGLMMDATEKLQKSAFNKAQKWRELLTPYGLYEVQAGGSAADIGKLRDLGTVLFGTRPDSQRYFDYHHAVTDVFENVHKRELEMGAASMAAWVFLMDKYGF